MIRFWFAVMRKSPLWIFGSPAGQFSADAPDNQGCDHFDKQRQVPVIINALNPTNTIARPVNSYGRIGSNLIPARRSIPL